MKSCAGILLFAGLALAQGGAQKGAQAPNPYFGGCDYTPLGQDAPYYNCYWLPDGGLDACQSVAGDCLQECFRAGSQDNRSGFQVVAENDNDKEQICRCQCKLN
ncbi:hypothetical protein CERZMDRAFT_82433 [Cercospora zeae-maydis SCOH1-5]|uniref:Uncharacterized protein n=1 Tax=Cercospora zeae-maydis SCOH1-5 TaxID=717836 RepID=A0A6A6FPW8_9PEZI|nr:hypothetical protein CERZMDRAFT_82433 [Cercospora zeae-maydis SCOH1-5]